jgi:hypothetical protein
MPKKERKLKVETEAKYEISMYKLMILVMIGIFISIGIGFATGNRIGTLTAINEAKLPEYCAVYKESGNVEIRCTELNVPANQFCNMLSPELERQVKVVMITS